MNFMGSLNATTVGEANEACTSSQLPPSDAEIRYSFLSGSHTERIQDVSVAEVQDCYWSSRKRPSQANQEK